MIHEFGIKRAAGKTVIASAAKQSRSFTRKRTGLLRRFAPRNDEKHDPTYGLHIEHLELYGSHFR
jgi:hypothetical protein